MADTDIPDLEAEAHSINIEENKLAAKRKRLARWKRQEEEASKRKLEDTDKADPDHAAAMASDQQENKKSRVDGGFGEAVVPPVVGAPQVRP